MNYDKFGHLTEDQPLHSQFRHIVLSFLLTLAACGGVESGAPPVGIATTSGSPASSPGSTPPAANDTTAPSVAITSPSANASVSGSSLAVTAQASDNVAVAGVQFKLNGVNTGAEDTSAPYSLTFDTTKVPNGAYALTAVARDSSGNSRTSAAINVSVLNSTPVPPTPAPTDTSAPTVPGGLRTTGVSAFQVDLAWNAASDNVGVAGYKVFRNGNQIGTTTQLAFQVSGLNPQTSYAFAIAAFDAANNVSQLSVSANATTSAVTVGSSMADLAARLKSGEWGELTTSGFDSGDLLYTSRAASPILSYTDEAAWDSKTRQLLFIGGGHGDEIGRFVRYSDSGNAWTVLPSQPFTDDIAIHAYNNIAIDVERGYYYQVQGLKNVYRYNISAGTWSQLPSIPMSSPTIAGALEYFPERDSLYYVNGSGGEVWQYSMQGTSWTRIASGLAMSEYHNVSRYNPVHKVMIFGAGNGDLNLHMMDASGKISKISNVEVGMGVRRSILTVDPVSGKYLVFLKGGDYYEFDVINNTWRLLGNKKLTDDYGDLNTIAVSIPNYGVVMLVQANFGDSRVYLYKH